MNLCRKLYGRARRISGGAKAYQIHFEHNFKYGSQWVRVGVCLFWNETSEKVVEIDSPSHLRNIPTSHTGSQTPCVVDDADQETHRMVEGHAKEEKRLCQLHLSREAGRKRWPYKRETKSIAFAWIRIEPLVNYVVTNYKGWGQKGHNCSTNLEYNLRYKFWRRFLKKN